MTTPVADAGPLFVAVTVKVTSSPTSGAESSTGLGDRRRRSHTGICACTGPAVTDCPIRCAGRHGGRVDEVSVRH